MNGEVFGSNMANAMPSGFSGTTSHTKAIASQDQRTNMCSMTGKLHAYNMIASFHLTRSTNICQKYIAVITLQNLRDYDRDPSLTVEKWYVRFVRRPVFCAYALCFQSMLSSVIMHKRHKKSARIQNLLDSAQIGHTPAIYSLEKGFCSWRSDQ